MSSGQRSKAVVLLFCLYLPEQSATRGLPRGESGNADQVHVSSREERKNKNKQNQVFQGRRAKTTRGTSCLWTSSARWYTQRQGETRGASLLRTALPCPGCSRDVTPLLRALPPAAPARPSPSSCPPHPHKVNPAVPSITTC